MARQPRPTPQPHRPLRPWPLQAQAIRTHSKGLLFVQLTRDAAAMWQAWADYVVVMRTPGRNDRPIPSDLTQEEWIDYARPVWHGIRETDVLGAHEARDNDDERHLCPLQLPVIERCVRLWSAPGETVLSPFAGIGSEGVGALRRTQAVLLPRRPTQPAGRRARRQRRHALRPRRGGERVMPIRSENRDRYPADWATISLTIRASRAGGRCECDGRCGSRHCAPAVSLTFAAHGTPGHPIPDLRCTAHNGQPHPSTGSRVVLTVAHLDHRPEHNDPANLAALCQACHLAYDATKHATSRRRRRGQIASNRPASRP